MKWETSVGSTVDFGGEVAEEEVEVEEKRISGAELDGRADRIRACTGELTGKIGCFGFGRRTRMERDAFMAMVWGCGKGNAEASVLQCS